MHIQLPEILLLIQVRAAGPVENTQYVNYRRTLTDICILNYKLFLQTHTDKNVQKKKQIRMEHGLRYRKELFLKWGYKMSIQKHKTGHHQNRDTLRLQRS